MLPIDAETARMVRTTSKLTAMLLKAFRDRDLARSRKPLRRNLRFRRYRH